FGASVAPPTQEGNRKLGYSSPNPPRGRGAAAAAGWSYPGAAAAAGVFPVVIANSVSVLASPFGRGVMR
ncbi:MAG: hypothetical protein FWH14_08600, partial [Oscillospiraceae bacterium]|nr:hypothetical protein [Oscillospiraceae bacterium]